MNWFPYLSPAACSFKLEPKSVYRPCTFLLVMADCVHVSGVVRPLAFYTRPPPLNFRVCVCVCVCVCVSTRLDDHFPRACGFSSLVSCSFFRMCRLRSDDFNVNAEQVVSALLQVREVSQKRDRSPRVLPTDLAKSEKRSKVDSSGCSWSRPIL